MKIAINKPCHEDWNKMTPNEQGAFCGVCTKSVVDFSKKSLEEIKIFFSKPVTSKLCGRFTEDQLVELNTETFIEKFIGFRFTRKVAMITALAFVAFLTTPQISTAQSTKPVKMGKIKAPTTQTSNTITPVKSTKDKSDSTQKETVPIIEYRTGDVAAKPIKEGEIVYKETELIPEKAKEPIKPATLTPKTNNKPKVKPKQSKK
jgi:hypothetical protein